MTAGVDRRLAALRRFAISITIFNLAGHTVLGFEQAWIVPIVAVLTAYLVDLGLETADAWAARRPPRYAGGPRAVVDFLLPAHIAGLAVSMLLYANQRLLPIVFAVAVAIASKTLLRAPVGGRWRHFLNPSNFGITVTLVLFPWVSISPPYHFTEKVDGIVDLLIPAGIVAAGTLLNGKLTGKMPLIAAWAGGFVVQAVVRAVAFDTPVVAGLLPMTGVAFVLFTNYMITDPSTTPVRPGRQVAFGLTAAAVYGLLMLVHVVFTLFFALVITCALRGMGLLLLAAVQARRAQPAAVPAAVPVGVTATRPEPEVARS